MSTTTSSRRRPSVNASSEGAFIEHAEVHGNMYGTLKAPMEEAIEAGKVYIVEIDVQELCS